MSRPHLHSLPPRLAAPILGALGVLGSWGIAAAQARHDAPYEAVVRGDDPGDLPSERSGTLLTRADMDRRQPRSAPDALRYEPGVYVQQTAHGQGSPILRGLTGEQTLMLFDGIRLNNSTYRQGPNQYFFTLDARSIAAIQVMRGGGSTRYGSDALGGVIAAYPVEPVRALPTDRVLVRPRLFARFTTADTEKGGRAEVTISAVRRGVGVRFIAGAGGRDVGLLESAGPVDNPNPSTPLGPHPYVPRYARDGRTQLGTGFKELTADGRLVLDLGERHRVTLAAYSYMQLDVPRTDQCPAPTAPSDTCLIYDQQFRHLAYAAWDGDLGAWARKARVSVSYQEQHEARRNENPGIFTRIYGLDDVHTLGLVAKAGTDVWRPREAVGLSLIYGADTYLDLVRSEARQYYTDTDVTSPLSRGQYLDGSSYLYGGAFVDGEARLGRRVIVRAGGRFSWITASAPGDPESGSSPLDQRWLPVVGHAGVEWRALRWLHLLGNVDHSFRAPNLNDMTARQQTGPGFQFENAALLPERATSFEAGVRVRHRLVEADLWGFETLLQDAILKVSKTAAECPAETPQCLASWTRFQLQNSPEPAELRGIEATARALLPAGFSLRATLTYTWGEGPRVGSLAKGVFGVVLGDRVPLSRVPPLNGTVEAGWTGRSGLSLGAGLRWAAEQDRLAIADYSDGRIPKYGTPGFAVLDLRGSYRVDRHLLVSAIFENVLDASYRYHGSSIEGPGRGFILAVRVL